MGNKISGKEFPLSKIFSKDFDYYIPSYQRPYSWEETHTETLLDNLYDFYKENKTDDYFLGSIVLIKEENNPYAEVIDGQQRLTTLTILLAAIANRLTGKIKETCLNYIIESGNEIEGIPERPRLHLREKDRAFFKKYIQDLKIQELLKCDETQFANEAQQHIKNNCKVINDKLEKYFGKDENELKEFCSFIAVRCCLVTVYTANKESAFRIFSIMNSTGLDLSATDIIKSEIIGKINSSDQQDYTDKWEDMEIKTTRQGFADLFSHIRMIFMQVKAKKSLLEEFNVNVVPQYTPKKLIDEVIQPYSECYAVIKEGNFKSSVKADEINSNIMWLKKVENSDWMPSAIFFMSKHLNDAEYLSWFFAKLERLSAYLYITGKDVNERIERYAQVLSEIKNSVNSSLDNPLKSIELTKDENDNFVKILNGEIYTLSSKRRNYVVLRLDRFVADGGAIYNPKIFTVEHVLPQTVAVGSKWAQVWPNENDRYKWLNRIANLVPLPRRKNSEAQNFDFDLKKQKYFLSAKGTSSYALTSQVIMVSDWDEVTVEDRQNKLMDIFKTNWELS